MRSAIGNTLQHAVFLSQHLHKYGLKCITVAILLEIGIPANRIGFEYLIHAILLYYHDPSQAIMKELYPKIAVAVGPSVDVNQVESAIRAAIAEAWKNRNQKVWNRYFPQFAGRKMDRPSNTEFISEIARFLELCHDCCEEVAYE